MTDEDEMLDLFRQIYGHSDGTCVSSAPGRVNVIGEHTDYNDGFVLPTPLSRRVWVASAKRVDKTLRIYAADYGQKYCASVDRLQVSKERGWANYVMGVVYAMGKSGCVPFGADVLVKGDVPQGAGLSSSGALEVATARSLVSTFGLDVDPVTLANWGRLAENEFVGVKSGIMDQFVASLGRYGKALLIDCRSNDYRHVPIPPGYGFVAVHTGIHRKLDSSAYNERVNQCQDGVRALVELGKNVTSLRDVSPEDLEEVRHVLPEVVYRRCRHVVSENVRVLQSVKAADSHDAARLGALMYESHESLRDDYEVSCRELDILVEVAKGTGLVLGARLTGAGFGGCTVNLLALHNFNEFEENVTMLYRNATGLDATVYRV